MAVGEYVFAAGLTALVVALLYRFHGCIALPEVRVRWLDPPITIALGLSIWRLGMRQFGGYDHSSMIQAGWLQLSSLVPFKDYPCTFPPLFFLGARYAFLLFGVRWSAFVLLMALFAALSFLFLTLQFRALGLPVIGAAILALTAEVGTTVVCSFWWYNPITSVAVVMVFVSTLVCLANPQKFTAWALLGVALILLILSKPNAWPAGACVIPLYCTRETGRRMRALAVLILGVTVSGIICWLHGLSPIGVLRTYSEIADTRGNPWNLIGLRDFMPVERNILSALTGVIVLLFLFLFASALRSGRKELPRYWREYTCCAIAAVTSLAMISMNFELKTSDMMPLIVSLAVVAFRPWSARRLHGVGRAATVIVIVFFATLSCYWGVSRLRVRGIGERMFFEDGPTQTIDSGFFTGLHSGPRLIAVLQQVEAALNQYPSRRVFFGPRMEFSYAAFRRDPPPGLPIWWHPGSSFPLEDFVAVSRAFENDDFDVLIFLKDDYTRMPVAALLHKLPAYERVPGFSELDVYVRRRGI